RHAVREPALGCHQVPATGTGSDLSPDRLCRVVQQQRLHRSDAGAVQVLRGDVVPGRIKLFARRRCLSIVPIWTSVAMFCAPVLAHDLFPWPAAGSSLFSDDSGSRRVASPEDEREDAANREGEAAEGERDEIETDRDSFTPATTLVTPGRFILESAYTFIDNRRVFETHSFPEAVLRYGVTDWFEARLQWNFEIGGAGDLVSTGAGDEEFFGGGVESESQIGYGFKLKATEQQGWIPESAFLVLGFTPTSGKEHASSFIGTYVWGWKMPNRWKLDAAFRYSADSENGDGHNLWAPSVVLKVLLWERVNVHAEYF